MFSRVYDQYDIVDQLKLEFKNRIENINKKELRNGYIHGTLDDKMFCMTYEYDNYIVLSSDDVDVIDNMQRFCSAIIGEYAICSYDLVDEESHNSYSTMEWNVRNPNKRLTDLMNGKAYDKDFTIYNFRYRTDALGVQEEQRLAK